MALAWIGVLAAALAVAFAAASAALDRILWEPSGGPSWDDHVAQALALACDTPGV